MAYLDRPGLCEFAEYERAFVDRLKEGQLTSGEILACYLRLAKRREALMAVVEVQVNPRRELGALSVSIALLDDDLKPIQPGEPPCEGSFVDGIWNSTGPITICASINRHTSIPTHDGVFRPYEDGIDMSMFEQELVGASASGFSDTSSRPMTF